MDPFEKEISVAMAYKYFKNGNFDKALEAYTFLSKKINERVFIAEIEKCKKILNIGHCVDGVQNRICNRFYLKPRRNTQASGFVKFSIVVVSYNQEGCIERAINSCINQTYKNIEIVCVDDHSSDRSASIIKKMAELDGRITVIVHDGNFSAHMCRKNGVLNSSGEYILFLDGDDELEKNLCEKLVPLTKKGCDIIHFATKIIPILDTQKNAAISLEQSLKPKAEYIENKSSLLEEIFLKKIAGFNLWNKCVERYVAIKAFTMLDDVYLARGNDTYALTAIALCSKKYLGEAQLCGYKYYYGMGIYGNSEYTVDIFRRLLGLYETYKNINSLLAKEFPGSICEEISNMLYTTYLKDAGYRLLNFVMSRDIKECFSLFCDVYGISEAVSSIAMSTWNNENKRMSFFNSYHDHDVEVSNDIINDDSKNIAIIYHRLNIGGVQRVIVEMARLFLTMNKNVTIVIFETHDVQLDIPRNVKLFVIDIPCSVNGYRERSKELSSIIVNENIDTVYYNMYSDKFILYDIVLFREMGVKLVLHIHSVFTVMLRNKFNMNLNSAVEVLKRADALIVLSTVDKKFWSYFSDNVHFIPNPVTVNNPPSEPAALNTHNILFVGRFDKGKRVDHAIHAFAKVNKEIPDSNLIIVGDSNASDVKNDIDAAIRKHGLQKKVKLAGFQSDVGKYFSEAAVLVITSAYEGYSLVLAEAKIYGIPVVMYNLPTLELQRNGKGVIVVEQCDFESLANEVVKLIKNYGYRRKIGYEGFKNGIELLKDDLSRRWEDVFQSIKGKCRNHAKQNETLQILLNDTAEVLSSLQK